MNTDYHLKTIAILTSFWSLLTIAELDLSPFLLNVQLDVKTQVWIISSPHSLDVKTKICWLVLHNCQGSKIQRW